MSRSHWSDRAYIGFPFACSPDPKIAGCVTETATRVRIAFAAACPEAELFRGVARSLQLAGP